MSLLKLNTYPGCSTVKSRLSCSLTMTNHDQPSSAVQLEVAVGDVAGPGCSLTLLCCSGQVFSLWIQYFDVYSYDRTTK